MGILDSFKQNNVEDDDLYDDELDAVTEYNERLKDLWLCIGFCIAGWIVACIGFAIFPTNDLGFLLIIAGVIIVDLPCYKVLLAGGSIATLLGASFGAPRVIYYTDGTKETDHSGWSAGMAASIFAWLATLVVGVLAMVLRIFRNFFSCMSLKKDADIDNDVKKAPWLPVVVGIAVFILGLIISNVAAGAIEYNEVWQDDFDDATSIEMLTNVVDGMEKEGFSYEIYLGENATEKLEVTHSAATGGATQGTYYITVPAEAATVLGIEAGSYMRYADGSWQKGDMFSSATVTDTATIAVLEEYTVKGFLAYDIIVDDIENLTVYDRKFEPDGWFDVVYRFHYHVEAEHGYEMFFDAGEKDGVWRIRMVEKPFSWPEYEYLGFFGV